MKHTEHTPNSEQARGARISNRWAARAGMTSLLMLSISSPGTLLCRSLAHKDLLFPQVAVGPAIQSVLTLTNRGNAPYQATVHFWTGEHRPWNPTVNGRPVSGSRFDIEIPARETRVFRFSGMEQAAGAARIECRNLDHDNFVQGHLVYDFEWEGYDSVGIAPSVELFRSAIPFEDFSTVGLALANPDPERLSVVKLRLLDHLGVERESVMRVLGEQSHEARFLSEFFSASVQAGTVEISASEPIIGTAVTLVKGEISALPLNPSPVAYTFQTEQDGEIDLAEAVLWAEGCFVKGYLRFLFVDGQPLPHPENYLVTGTLRDQTLRLTQVGAGQVIAGVETVSSLKVERFSFDGQAWTGTYTRIQNGFPFLRIVEGNFQMTRKEWSR